MKLNAVGGSSRLTIEEIEESDTVNFNRNPKRQETIRRHRQPCIEGNPGAGDIGCESSPIRTRRRGDLRNDRAAFAISEDEAIVRILLRFHGNQRRGDRIDRFLYGRHPVRLQQGPRRLDGSQLGNRRRYGGTAHILRIRVRRGLDGPPLGTALGLGCRRRGGHQENDKECSADHLFPSSSRARYGEDTLLS